MSYLRAKPGRNMLSVNATRAWKHNERTCAGSVEIPRIRKLESLDDQQAQAGKAGVVTTKVNLRLSSATPAYKNVG